MVAANDLVSAETDRPAKRRLANVDVLAFKNVTLSLDGERHVKRMNQTASLLSGFSSGASLGGKVSR
jgi:hypothetical protein